MTPSASESAWHLYLAIYFGLMALFFMAWFRFTAIVTNWNASELEQERLTPPKQN